MMVYILALQVSSHGDHEEWEEKLAWDEAMDESRMDATFREKGREYFSLTNERKKRSVRE